MESPRKRSASKTISQYLSVVNDAVRQLKDPDGAPVQIPDYAALQTAASHLDQSKQASDTALVIQRLLGRGAGVGMTAPGTDYKLSFPADHHLHPTMGAEWYYLGCNLSTKGPAGEMQRIGVMVWMQKNRMVGDATQAEAGWSDEDCLIVASKVTVVLESESGDGRIIRRSRNIQWPLQGGKIGYSKQGEDFRIECGEDSLAGSQNVLPLRTKVQDGDRLVLDLVADCRDSLTAEKAFFLRGDGGSGITGLPTPGFEYSWPQLEISGAVTVDGITYEVESGSGWIDHQLLMASLEDPPGTPAGVMVPFIDDPKPFVGWCWMFFNLENGDAFTCIALNLFGLSLQLAATPGAGYYLSIDDGQWKAVPLDAPGGTMILSEFRALATVTDQSGPDRPDALIPSGWLLGDMKSTTWDKTLAGSVKGWTEEATFNAEDWSLLSEMPVDYVDTAGKFANGSGYCEAIGFENVLSYRKRALAFLENQGAC